MRKKIMILSAAVVLASGYLMAEEKGGGTMRIASPAFQNNGAIPAKYTCEGEDINPELTISGIPKGTLSLALIVDDPDAPMGTWVHWVVFDIPVGEVIKENSVPGRLGVNTAGVMSFHGPCPPTGAHRYFFKLYALDALLNLREGIRKSDLEKAMQGHILEQAELVGLYRKQKK